MHLALASLRPINVAVASLDLKRVGVAGDVRAGRRARADGISGSGADAVQDRSGVRLTGISRVFPLCNTTCHAR